jgi:hypothetical protein
MLSQDEIGAILGIGIPALFFIALGIWSVRKIGRA